jgi:hypothetical protein
VLWSRAAIRNLSITFVVLITCRETKSRDFVFYFFSLNFLSKDELNEA